MPYGYVLSLGVSTILSSPVLGTSRPTIPDWSVNHSVPFWSKIGVCGPRAQAGATAASGTG